MVFRNTNLYIRSEAGGGVYAQILLRTLEKNGLPTHPSPERAVKAMRVLLISAL